MTRFSTIAELADVGRSLHLAMGVFDGLHLGHQAVIKAAVRGAEISGGAPGVLTFEPHPIQVLSPENAPRRIFSSLEQKEILLSALGVEILLVLRFDEVMAGQTADTFAKSLLSVPDLRQLVAGEDWKFGQGRQGTMAFLQGRGMDYNVSVEPIPAVTWQGERISSTRLRRALRAGNLNSVREMLGRPYSVMGTIVRGEQVGRELGAPTANIQTGDEQFPPDGVYAVSVRIDGESREREAVANLGIRPTVGGTQHLLEVHLLDFEGNLYGRTLEIFFGKMIRGEKQFQGLAELQNQIQLDLEEVRRLFKASEAGLGADGRFDSGS
ncbi:MAG TPA: riboflavin biosynthesis protein RibF [Verrucomicrobiales bacterium]|nr:riboflavin biosynthesis protein RibF [Roseibacillus sp.]HBM77716.1 riboflavin biosynthesis protein RibF [Verrucomicrobiales bacterium]